MIVSAKEIEDVRDLNALDWVDVVKKTCNVILMNSTTLLGQEGVRKTKNVLEEEPVILEI